MTGYQLAKSMIGKHENKDTIELDTFIKKYLNIWTGNHVNSTPWCAAIMNAWERASGKPGNGMVNARSFSSYGSPVTIKNAKEGDIVVFSRGGSSWQGHVAYYAGQQGNLIKTIGGNQSDSICIGWYPKDRVVAIRRS